MKSIAILVIAATNQPVYIHYIKTYWTELIRHLGAARPHIDVFLLFENAVDIGPFDDLRAHIIQDPRSDLDALCSPEFQRADIPGVLSKTIHALEVLQGRYDVFFRTNLSSIIRVPYFDRFVQDRPDIAYAGGSVWSDALRADLTVKGKIGPQQSIRSLSELDSFPGNSFASGSGYFLGAAEAASLVQRKSRVRYDIVDDVSVGLMFPCCEYLPGFGLTVSPAESIAEIKNRIRDSGASHIRLEHFPLDKAQRLWKNIQHGQLWMVESPGEPKKGRYRIYFPLFDHVESRSAEVRMTHEGLQAHPQVNRVDDPESADYLVFCQNHLVEHCPFHATFRPIKDKFKGKSVMMDFDDNPHVVYDREDFRWALYFKRSCVDRRNNRPVDYGGLPVVPTAYGVVDDMVEPPENSGKGREIAVSCLFEDAVRDYSVFRQRRGRLLEFAKSLAARYDVPMQIGLVSPCGPVGRSGVDERYKRCLYNSKIVLHANPDPWEGDSRTWEAISAGALVFVDRMCQPYPHPLIDGDHVIFYDLNDEGMKELERKIVFYLHHEEERARIGRQGREFVLARHRSINQINELIWELDASAADTAELRAILSLERAIRSGVRPDP